MLLRELQPMADSMLEQEPLCLLLQTPTTAHLFIRGIFMDSMYHLVKIREYETGKE